MKQKEAKTSGVSLDCHEKTKGGETPLMLSVLHNHYECVKILIEKGASSTAKDDFGRTALHRVVIPADQQIMMELFQTNDREADVTVRDENGMTPFHVAALDNETGQYIYNVMIHVADISNGCHLMPDNRGFSPLHYAAFKGNIEFIQNFLSTEVNYLENVDDQQNAIDKILGIKSSDKYYGNDDDDVIEEELNEAGEVVSMNYFKYNKFTALHCAAYSDNYQVVDELLKSYMKRQNDSDDEEEGEQNNFLIQDKFGRTPLHIACMANEASRDTTDLLVACESLALSRHDVKDVCGMTPPMVAAKFNNVDCLDCIVEAVGTDRFNWLYQDKWENTILSTACNYVSEDFAVYCVNCVEKDHKCLTMVNKNGDGALHLAAKNGMSAVVRLLLAKGAGSTMSFRNRTEEETPLDVCLPDPDMRQCLGLMLAHIMTTEIEQRVREEVSKYKPPVPPKKSPKGGKGKNHSRNTSRDSGDIQINIEPFDVTQILSLQAMPMDEGDVSYSEEF
jgi:serine/threonine-protein phosphatase 6 regulatory ankyrin repeat subunit C